jgi:hypothetical protein
MGLLDDSTSGKRRRPPRILLYGTEGIGKSTFASKSPRPYFIATEDGLGEIDCVSSPVLRRLEDVQSRIVMLLDEQHDFQTVVIDSADWLERLVWDALCREYRVGNIEKVDGGFAKGYKHALTYWRPILDSLDTLRDQRGMAVILLAHAKTVKFEEPGIKAYDRYEPRLHDLASALVREWAEAVLFAHQKVIVQTEDAGFNRTRGIASALGTNDSSRVLQTTLSPSAVAKNRYSLPEELPLDWDAFVSSMAS